MFKYLYMYIYVDFILKYYALLRINIPTYLYYTNNETRLLNNCSTSNISYDAV